MASIRKRGERWQAQVRRNAAAPTSKSFLNRSDALVWARQMEAAADMRQLPLPHMRPAEPIRFDTLLTRYLAEVSPRKRGADVERIRIDMLSRSSLGPRDVTDGFARHLSEFRDKRLQHVSPGTVRREFVIIRHVLETAAREWCLPIGENPAARIRLPSPPQGRERRLFDTELGLLMESLKKSRNALIKPVVLMAIETGMRRGELLAMRWGDVNLRQGLLSIPQTKTGRSRVIPLTNGATKVLKGLKVEDASVRVFPMTPNALRIAWSRLTARAGVEDLHFHDLRHEAVSRFFELGLTLAEVALISGHRDPRMLLRYTHLRAQDVRRSIQALRRSKSRKKRAWVNGTQEHKQANANKRHSLQHE